MKLLPKSLARRRHFRPLLRGLLATLAIVVWHFYSIIFDPDVYPLNTAFLTGKSVKKQESTESEKPQAHVAGD